MTSNVALAWQNEASAATISCASALSNLGPSQLLLPPVDRRMRIAGLSSGSVEFDVNLSWSMAKEISLICWLRPRLRADLEQSSASSFVATDQVRHTLSAVSQDGAELYDSGWIASGMAAGLGYHAHFLPSPITGVMYGRTQFRATSRDTYPENFVDLGWTYWGPCLDFSIGYAAPFEERFFDGATIQRAPRSPSDYVSETRRPWRGWTAPFRTLPNQEADQLRDAMMRLGQSGLVLLCRDKTAPHENTIRGRIGAPGLSRPGRRFYASTLTITESY